MLFAPDMLKAVLEGRKHQTRRPVKDGDWVKWQLPADMPDFLETTHHSYVDVMTADDDCAILSVIRRDRPQWRVGQTYAVCPGRGKKGVGRILITDIRAESPCLISDDDARAEGFDSREAFFDKLRALYGDSVDLDALYWVLEFELVKGE
jgi:hypothetical protein